MTDPNAFAKMVPGFDFLQGLMKNAGGGVPAMSQWIAPTLDPQELDKRIGDLRTVQFWLEQNARLIATSIQALEVQRMTLATLQTMNLPMAGLHEAMTLRPPAPAPAATPAAMPEAPPPAPAPEPASAPAGRADAEPDGPASGEKSPAVDPMQWWGALTKQFGEIAARALEDMPGVAAAASATQSATKSTGKPAGKPAGKAAAKVGDADAAPAPRAPARKRTATAKRARGR